MIGKLNLIQIEKEHLYSTLIYSTYSDRNCYAKGALGGIIVTLDLSEQDRWHLIKKWPKCSGHTLGFFAIKDICVQTAIRAKYTVYNDSQPAFLLYKDLLFISSSPTYDWCDTEGQQRTTILGVGGRQS